MSGGQSLLLVRTGDTVWGLDNGRVSRVSRGAETFRVEVGATPLAADGRLLWSDGPDGRVAPRRDAQTIYYRLTDHAFNKKLRENFFKQFQV